jgi:hypothetical protein
MPTIPTAPPSCPPLDTWASAIIDRGRQLGQVPRYGSTEWAALSPSDPRAVAACVVAAECWRDYTDPATVRRDLELEITASRQVARGEQSAAFAELAAGVRALVTVPTQTELAARRAVVVA